MTSGGETVRAGTVVVAAGALTRTLLPRTGIVSGTGYSLDLTSETARAPVRPIFLSEARVAITPLAGRLRLAGTMVLERQPRPEPDPRRLAGIRRAGMEALPAWAAVRRSAGWAGARPCTFDGLPRIGRRGGVIVAAGHGMLGVTLAPITGRLVRGIIDGRPDPRLATLNARRGSSASP